MSCIDRDLSSAAQLFALLWESLADILGTAATATLLRRAIKRASFKTSSTEPPVTVTRNGLDYEYRLPETWKQPDNQEALDEFRVIALELRVLLVELTGAVVVRRLARLAPFKKMGIDFTTEAK